MYPEDSIQNMLEPSDWWIQDDSFSFDRGYLIRAFLPHVDQIPKTVIFSGRTNPIEHNSAEIRIEPLRVKRRPKKPFLPVSGAPLFGGEQYVLNRAKKRPAIILSGGGTEIDKALNRGKPNWQTSPHILVAPFYGVDENGQRAGFNPNFIKAVRSGKYRQLMWDKLPLNSKTEESILYFNHIQPIGRHHDSIEYTGYRLSDDALMVFEDWLKWFINDDYEEGDFVGEFKKCIMDLEAFDDGCESS